MYAIPPNELEGYITPPLFTELRADYELSPWGETRLDLLFAMIASCLTHQPASEFLLFQPKRELTQEEQDYIVQERMKAIAAQSQRFFKEVNGS